MMLSSCHSLVYTIYNSSYVKATFDAAKIDNSILKSNALKIDCKAEETELIVQATRAWG